LLHCSLLTNQHEQSTFANENFTLTNQRISKSAFVRVLSMSLFRYVALLNFVAFSLFRSFDVALSSR